MTDSTEPLVLMELSRVLIRETEDTHFLELREAEPDADHEARTFPIVIGFTEAAAIERRLMGQTPERPQTHELLSAVIERLNHVLDRVVINDLHDQTFFARVHLRHRGSGEVVELDARPSDAIALSADRETPIFVAEHVLSHVNA
ncbi:bifunctional nuclease family protein [Phycisphaera mikurensis]|uniref:BFN domain-containing protein n=1 Tax=Phycisphaera mikurensis (strain NBRC 102666 / KCTC 22515 / FYK2301M01) TaxID=1142394 RepID=I0IBX0_PHYMF|nr:bifunctional nuclease family protein [Phycisphaera mikurensis]MBB6442017.1 hypothetical protein [Phycisphaera mikurensis]BAM02758.1 hypothetical protein PSMK_05990 [Phycisphaera mikurensis NBRC 102666]